MKIIKKSFIILIFLSYFFIFGRQLESEISFIPLWVENIEFEGLVSEEIKENSIDFRLDDKFGYLDRNGRVLFVENLLFGVAIDQDGFINYSRQNEVLVLKDREGFFINTIDISGYPYFSGNRRFILSYDSNGISEIDHEGSLVWQKTFSSSITSLSVAGSFLFLGTVDGGIRLMDSSGSVVFDYITKNSRINVIYGGAVSSNGELMMTISGLEPQLLTLWTKDGSEYQEQITWSLQTELRRHAIAGISEDGLYAYVEIEEELLLIELKNKKLFSIPITGRLQNIYFNGNSELIYVLSQDSNGSYLLISETDGKKLFYNRLPGNGSMLKEGFGRIILGIDTNLISYGVESL